MKPLNLIYKTLKSIMKLQFMTMLFLPPPIIHKYLSAYQSTTADKYF